MKGVVCFYYKQIESKYFQEEKIVFFLSLVHSEREHYLRIYVRSLFIDGK